MDLGPKLTKQRQTPGRLYLALGVMLLWCSPGWAQSSLKAEFNQAKNSYTYGNYGDSIRRFQQLLYPLPGRLRSRNLRQQAHKYLGLSYYYLFLRSKKERFQRASERELTLFLLQDPNATLDPLLYPPNLVSFFSKVRQKNRQRLAKILQRRRRKRNSVRVQVLSLRIEKRVFQYSPWLAVIPFGTPQLLVRQNVKGGLLLAGQALALGINVTAYFAIFSMQIKNDKFNLGRFKESDIPKVVAWQVTQGVSLGLLGAMVIYGVIDGVIQLRKRRVTMLPDLPSINRKKLRLPPPPQTPSFSIAAQ